MILAIIQARMSSSRLPGKVLKNIVNKPVLALQIERLLQCKNIDKLIVATSNENSDNAIDTTCNTLNVECYRGDLHDVLSRFYHLTIQYNPQHIVRLTADCPLTDPTLIDKVITYHIQGNFDYTTNIYPRSYPDGLDVEVLTQDLIKHLHSVVIEKEDKEHVTYYLEKRILNNTLTDIKVGNVRQKQDLSTLRWTLDTEEDFQFISNIYQALYKKNPLFTTQDILDYLHD